MPTNWRGMAEKAGSLSDTMPRLLIEYLIRCVSHSYGALALSTLLRSSSSPASPTVSCHPVVLHCMCDTVDKSSASSVKTLLRLDPKLAFSRHCHLIPVVPNARILVDKRCSCIV